MADDSAAAPESEVHASRPQFRRMPLALRVVLIILGLPIGAAVLGIAVGFLMFFGGAMVGMVNSFGGGESVGPSWDARMMDAGIDLAMKCWPFVLLFAIIGGLVAGPYWIMRREGQRTWTVLLVSVALGVAVNVGAAALAQIQFEAISLHGVVGAAFWSVVAPVPILIGAVATAWAAHAYGSRAMYLVLAITLGSNGFWTHVGQLAEFQALAQHAWTGSALAVPFAWLWSVVSVSITACLVLFAYASARRRAALKATPAEAIQQVQAGLNEPTATRTLGTTSLVLGILSILSPYVGVVLGIAAIWLALVQRKHKRTPMVDAGLACGIIGVCLWGQQLIMRAIVVAKH